MKTHKHFSHPSEEFFHRQAEEIGSNTLGLDSWKLKGAGPVEKSFPLADSCWHQMEEGIRQRIRQPESVWSLSLFTWKPALALLVVLISLGIGMRFYLATPSEEELAAAKMEELKQEEILLYLTEQPENLDLSQQVALQNLPDNALDIPVDYNPEELIDDNNLNETDFESSL
jgi:hypothetical protein